MMVRRLKDRPGGRAPLLFGPGRTPSQDGPEPLQRPDSGAGHGHHFAEFGPIVLRSARLKLPTLT